MERSDADVAVIGAGVMGCAIAIGARAASAMTCSFSSATSAPARGSTGASSAITRFNYSHITTVAASWESVHRWEVWSDYLGGTRG